MEERNQCLGVGETKEDWLLSGELNELETLDKIYIHYNQAELLDGVLSDFCTAISPISSISSIWNITLTEEQILDLWNYAKNSYGYEEGVGNYTQIGVKCACEWWNKNYPDKKVKFLRTTLFSQEEKEARKKNYQVIMSYRGNKAMNNDIKDNNCLDGYEFGEVTFGHCSKGVIESGKDISHNNYNGRPRNIFEIKHLDKLIDNGYFYPACYVITKTMNTQLEKDIADVQEAINIGITNNMQELKDVKVGKYTTDNKTTIKIMRSRRI